MAGVRRSVKEALTWKMIFSWAWKEKPDFVRQRRKKIQKQSMKINWEDRQALKIEIFKLNERGTTIFFGLIPPVSGT